MLYTFSLCNYGKYLLHSPLYFCPVLSLLFLLFHVLLFLICLVLSKM